MNTSDLILNCKKDWESYINHNFVKQLATGTLAEEDFKHYLLQDFLFLKHYARVFGLAIYKSSNIKDMLYALENAKAILEHEINHHVEYCKNWQISLQDMENTEEDYGTIAYTRYVIDVALSGNLQSLYVALAPCAIGYAKIGKNLINSKNTVLLNNPYISWIELYSSKDFQQVALSIEEHLNKLLKNINKDSETGKNLCNIFKTATRMETAFWQQAINKNQLPIG